ncbi:hypothetical protein T492DRAFT_1113813, partial [Pavlovales sp. CCMP2436]
LAVWLGLRGGTRRGRRVRGGEVGAQRVRVLLGDEGVARLAQQRAQGRAKFTDGQEGALHDQIRVGRERIEREAAVEREVLVEPGHRRLVRVAHLVDRAGGHGVLVARVPCVLDEAAELLNAGRLAVHLAREAEPRDIGRAPAGQALQILQRVRDVGQALGEHSDGWPERRDALHERLGAQLALAGRQRAHHLEEHYKNTHKGPCKQKNKKKKKK